MLALSKGRKLGASWVSVSPICGLRTWSGRASFDSASNDFAQSVVHPALNFAQSG